MRTAKLKEPVEPRVRLQVELTAAQFNEIKDWAANVRATPEQVAVVFAMQSVERLIQQDLSWEEEISLTMEGLRKFVDEGTCPSAEKFAPREEAAS